MLSFFRKIRHNILSEGKTARYFKYAIGEILLVVIGILIALQINNWNEARHSKIFEFKMLSELKTSLTKDLKMYDLLKERLTIKEKAINKILQVIKSNTEITNDELKIAIKDSGKKIVFSYDKGAYESIKSIGLDKIKTDLLRSHITFYYEVMILRYLVYIDLINNKNLPISNKYIKLFKINKLIYHEFEFVQDQGYKVNFIINDKEILKSKILEEWLLEEARLKYFYIRRLEGIIILSNKILQEVKQELSSRFKND